MANKGKNKIWTVIKILLAVAAIGVAAYAIYRKFFQKKTVEVLDDAEACDAPELDATEESDAQMTDEAADEAFEVSAEAVIANAEAMEA